MYVPEPFATDDAEVGAMLARAPLALLVTQGPQGLCATHLPMLFDAVAGTLAGHVARANPHAGLPIEGEALVVFQGPSAYVSPNWYASKAQHGKVVPTWNYEAVHVHGALTWRDDAEWILANVTALTNRFEAGQAKPWKVSDTPGDYARRLARGVVGVEIAIHRIEAKRKLSQNRPEADRQGVVTGLEAAEDPASLMVAAAMRSLEG